MGKHSHFRFRKGDFLAIALVAVLALAAFFLFLPSDQEAGSVELYQHGVLLRTVPLDQDQVFTVPGDYTNTVTIRSGAVAITCSDCPGQDCVGCGWISTPGRSIVCIPNSLELRLVGVASDVDFVVG